MLTLTVDGPPNWPCTVCLRTSRCAVEEEREVKPNRPRITKQRRREVAAHLLPAIAPTFLNVYPWFASFPAAACGCSSVVN